MKLDARIIHVSLARMVSPREQFSVVNQLAFPQQGGCFCDLEFLTETCKPQGAFPPAKVRKLLTPPARLREFTLKTSGFPPYRFAEASKVRLLQQGLSTTLQAQGNTGGRLK